MSYEVGTVFNIRTFNKPVPHVEISDLVSSGVTIHSIDKDTEILARTYNKHLGWFVVEGTVKFFTKTKEGVQQEWIVHEGEVLISPKDIPFGCYTMTPSIMSEVEMGAKVESTCVEVGKVFNIEDLVNCPSCKVPMYPLFVSGFVKMHILKVGAGKSYPLLAGGEVVLRCVSGNAIILYEGKERPIHKDEYFRFLEGQEIEIQAEDCFIASILTKMN